MGSNEECTVAIDESGNSSDYFVGIYDEDGNAIHVWGISQWLPESVGEINGRSLILDSRQNIYAIVSPMGN